MLPAAASGRPALRPNDSGLVPMEQAFKDRMGERGYARFEALKQRERQRVWDNMRVLAASRYKAGLMPPWFRREWLDIEEAPTNTWWRQQGLSTYQMDTRWLGEYAPSSSGGGGSGDGGDGGGGQGGGGWPRWWREEDPYWPLRDWGDHPLRWATWALAGLLAVGGVAVHAQTGCGAAARLGCGAAAVLGLSAVAMSDLRGSGPLGELGVKAAWATCVLLAWADFNGSGLAPQPPPPEPAAAPGSVYAYHPDDARQRQRRWGSSSSSGGGLRCTGWLCLSMAAAYMATGMSGAWEDTSLPTNPGAAFKMVDVAERHKVWTYWGYGGLTMR